MINRYEDGTFVSMRTHLTPTERRAVRRDQIRSRLGGCTHTPHHGYSTTWEKNKPAIYVASCKNFRHM